MTRWHVRPDGEPGVCSATKRPCKYGDEAHHYASKEDCLRALETENESKAAKTDGKKVLSHDATYPVDKLDAIRYRQVAGSTLYRMGDSPMLKELTSGRATDQSPLAKKIYTAYYDADWMKNSLSHGGVIQNETFDEVMAPVHEVEAALFKAGDDVPNRSLLRPTNKLVISKDRWHMTTVAYKYKKPNGRFDRSPMTITRYMFTNGEDLVAIDSADYNGDILMVVTNKNHPESTMSILKPSKTRLVLSDDNDEISSKKLNRLIDHLVREGTYGRHPTVNIGIFGTATVDNGSTHLVLSADDVDAMLSE